MKIIEIDFGKEVDIGSVKIIEQPAYGSQLSNNKWNGHGILRFYNKDYYHIPSTDNYTDHNNNQNVIKTIEFKNIPESQISGKGVFRIYNYKANITDGDKAKTAACIWTNNSEKTFNKNAAMKKYIDMNSNVIKTNIPSKAANKQLRIKQQNNIKTAMKNLKNVETKWPVDHSFDLSNKQLELRTHNADEMLKSSLNENFTNFENINNAFVTYGKQASTQVAIDTQNEYLKRITNDVKDIKQAVNKAKNDEINRSSHYTLPSVSEDCKNKGGHDCKWSDQKLLGCSRMTDDFVCKENENKNHWSACPYQVFRREIDEEYKEKGGNWRWKKIWDDKQKKVIRCIPPKEGTNGYRNSTKYLPKHYLREVS